MRLVLNTKPASTTAESYTHLLLLQLAFYTLVYFYLSGDLSLDAVEQLFKILIIYSCSRQVNFNIIYTDDTDYQ
jgi:hypothetical protein